KYTYDATGNRIYKEYISGGVTSRTWYARDAQGNTLAVYGNKNGDSQVYWNEQDLYGSSRLGIWQPGITLTAGTGAIAWNQEGLSRYELTNHLGNVLSTISDQRVGVDNDHNGTIDYYLPTIASYSDYTPFGMQMVDRNGSAGGYRYGFNGKENDNEIVADENSVNFEFREYDPRIGRFKSIDPKSLDYPWQSPFVYHRNNPISGVDYLGLGDPPKLDWEHFKERHLLSGNFSKSAPVNQPNSIVTNPAWQSRDAIEKLHAEALEVASKTGKTEVDVVLSNGTKWNINIKTGHFYPVEGEGITNISKSEAAILRAAKANGASGETIFENIAKNKSIDGTFSEEMQTSLNSLAEIEGVSAGKALKHIGRYMSSVETPALGAGEAALRRFGSVTKYVKWGGRTLLVVAAAADIYEIYSSQNKAKTITKVGGRWAGAWAGGTTAAAAYASVGGDMGGPWGWFGHAAFTLGGAISGAWVGEKTTETVYEWIFNKEE
ncbi:RHS repeat-associated core domain-containing protein, partial [Chitinophaga costaii]